MACESWLCGLQTETLMETTISLMKNMNLWWLSQTQLKKGVTFCCWYSRLLYSNLLASSFFIETPA